MTDAFTVAFAAYELRDAAYALRRMAIDDDESDFQDYLLRLSVKFRNASYELERAEPER